MVRSVVVVVGVFVVAFVLWDVFETVVLPRRVSRRVRLTALHFRVLWKFWAVTAGWLRHPARRESFLSLYGPLSLVLLLGTWAAGLMLGFAQIQWGLGLNVVAPERAPGFGTALYFSGVTLFTLGLGDVSPLSAAARFTTVIEAGMGFALLALFIGYLPVFYQAFSRREAEISMLDEWAGSPPTAGALLSRLGQWGEVGALTAFLAQWERWSAELLESHISYPILALFRSQHGNQSWLGGLTTVLDTCALVLTGVDGVRPRAAWLTFAMARHAMVDLAQIFDTPPTPPAQDRLPPAELQRLRAMLADAGVRLADSDEAGRRLDELRRMYEPYVNALAGRLLVTVPPWVPPAGAKDNWQKTRWS